MSPTSEQMESDGRLIVEISTNVKWLKESLEAHVKSEHKYIWERIGKESERLDAMKAQQDKSIGKSEAVAWILGSGGFVGIVTFLLTHIWK
jgi:hypothetical protein